MQRKEPYPCNPADTSEGHDTAPALRSPPQLTNVKLPPDRITGIEHKSVKARLRMATASANADILTALRSIVTSQLNTLKQDALQGTFSASQAAVLHKLAQTYSLIDSHTEKEHKKYDFSKESKEELESMEAQARRLLLE